jgi:hypothetical protein
MGLLLDFPLAALLAVANVIGTTPGREVGDIDRAAWIGAPALAAASVVAGPRPSRSAKTDEAWLANVKSAGDTADLAAAAARIFVTSSGRAYAPVATERDAILALRSDPERLAAVSYARATVERAEHLRATGEEPTVDHLVVALELGGVTTRKLFRLVESSPTATVAGSLPELAASHPGLAFGPRRPRTVVEALEQVRVPALAALQASMRVTASSVVVSSRGAVSDRNRSPKDALTGPRVAGWSTVVAPLVQRPAVPPMLTAISMSAARLESLRVGRPEGPTAPK